MAACASYYKESDSFSSSIGYIKTLIDLNIDRPITSPQFLIRLNLALL